MKSWSRFSLDTVGSWSCLGLIWPGLFDNSTLRVNPTRLEHLCHAWQVGQPPGRKASWDAFAPCSWTASLWTWRGEPRSPRGSDLGARVTAAATAPSARTRVCAWSGRTASPATAGCRPSPAPFVTKVRQFQFPVAPLCWQTHWRKLFSRAVFHN